MSEIKFACPHCGQHITCDAGYADLSIQCPTCNRPMEVPRLSALDPAHPDLCLVAEKPRPKPRLAARIPTIDVWTEPEWTERYRAATTPPERIPAWIVSALGTVIAAALVRAAQAPTWVIILSVVGGSGLSCLLLMKQQSLPTDAPSSVDLTGVLGTLAKIGLVLLAIPVIALGVLFIGCTVCH